jgi:hypothetical protein
VHLQSLLPVITAEWWAPADTAFTTDPVGNDTSAGVINTTPDWTTDHGDTTVFGADAAVEQAELAFNRSNVGPEKHQPTIPGTGVTVVNTSVSSATPKDAASVGESAGDSFGVC